MLKLCKDCKYFDKGEGPWIPVPMPIPQWALEDHCTNPRFVPIELTGTKDLRNMPICRDARSNPNQCGESGTYFEKRKSFWTLWM